MCFLEREMASAKTLDFTADQRDAALECLEDEVVVSRLAILGDDTFVLVVAGGLA